MKIPAKGCNRDELFSTLEDYRKGDNAWQNGRTWAYVFDPGEEATAVIKQAYMMFLSENALDPTEFRSAVRLENEVVSMCAHHLGGGPGTVGNFTSGGTESIILAVKAARDHARATRANLGVPEIIVPSTAHAAFHKAVHYLGMKAVVTPVDHTTFKADVGAIREAINENTVLLVASAVSYPQAVVDPVEEIAALAAEHGILCHVDGCMGGFILPYFRRLGAPVPNFDLSVKGVTSISMDLHKFAYAAKGASVVLYNDPELRKHQFFTCASWAGYTMFNTTVQSSKSVGPLAAAWAVLNYVGDAGYLKFAQQLLDATRRIVGGIREIDGLRVLGEPEMNLVAFTSDEVNVFLLIDEMNARGWYIQPQLGHPDCPPSVHLTIAPSNTRWIDELLADLRVCVDKVRGQQPGPLVAMAQQALAAIPDPSAIDGTVLKQLLALAGISGGGLPERKADINQLLNLLPPAFKERLLVEFMSDLFTPTADE